MATAGTSTGNLVNGVCSFVTSVDIQGDVLGTRDNSDIIDIGLPAPEIEYFIALPFLGLEPLEDLVLASSLSVLFGRSSIFPFSTCAFELVMHIFLILKKKCFIQIFCSDRVSAVVLSWCRTALTKHKVYGKYAGVLLP